jgi:hypothetical protein
MTTESNGDVYISIKLETLKHLFDLATDTPLVCSGSFDDDDVKVLRDTAVVIGVDPNNESITPPEFIAGYPHPFKRREVHAEPRIVHGWANRDGFAIDDDDPRTKRDHPLYRSLIRTHRTESGAEQRDRMAEERADPTCWAGTYGRRCGRPEADPLHHGVPLPPHEHDYIDDGDDGAQCECGETA